MEEGARGEKPEAIAEHRRDLLGAMATDGQAAAFGGPCEHPSVARYAARSSASTMK